LFSLLFAGLLLNHDAIPKPALWLQMVCSDFLSIVSFLLFFFSSLSFFIEFSSTLLKYSGFNAVFL
jgi:hypothetical protein